ncbi:MAG: SIR2 family NAD-dependent protein deacylase [Acidobacteriota bacterium]
MDMQAIDKVANLMASSNNTVVVTGAGISTEAGIPDFRGDKGIYRELGEERVMSIINIHAFRRSPELFYELYRQYFSFPPVEPSKAHYMLAQLEQNGLVRAVVTQNIDDLHQRAGSKKVIPVHGTANRFLCTNIKCQAEFEEEYVKNYPEVVPLCDKCRGVIKPDVVLFGEPIQNAMDARDTILAARLLIVIGSSLTVYPLAGFVKEFSTFYQDLVIINKGYTQLDHAALVKIDTDTTGLVLEKIYKKISNMGRS